MPGQDLRLLSLDGGGVRGLSTLFILQALMQRINPLDPPKPCDYFDMIGGTSTGGLIAIMLGRMRLSVRECIDAYTELASRVFVKEHLVPAKKLWKLHRAKLRARFSSEVLKQCIRDVLQKYQHSPDELLKDTLPMSCKVCVFATSTGTTTPVAIRSYPPVREADDIYQTARIWEVGRATSAASSFFDAIKIGPHKQEFTDGGTGANNPIQYIWNEAQDLYTPDNRLEDHVACIVSIGTGRPTFKEFGDDLASLANTMIRIATQTEETAEMFHQRNKQLANLGRYFRFNVGDGLGEIGLDEASKVGQIKDRTDNYLREQTNFEKLSRCANALKESGGSDQLTYQQSVHDLTLFGRFPVCDDSVIRWAKKNNLSLSTNCRTDNAEMYSLFDRISRYNPYRTHTLLERRRVEGTTDWIVAESGFLRWLSSAGTSYLWLCGKVGSGKTISMTKIVSETVHRMRRKFAVLHYFYQYPYNSALDLFRSLSKQLVGHLLATNSEVPTKAKMGLQDHYCQSMSQPILSEVLEHILIPLLELFPGCFVLVDGMEECPSEEVDKILTSLRDIGERLHLRVAIASRETPQISHRVALCEILRTDLPHLNADTQKSQLEVFVDVRLEEGPVSELVRDNDELRMYVSRELISKADGMFIYAKLQLDLLAQCANFAEVRQALSDPPNGLFDLYWRCLKRDLLYSKYTSRILRWVCAAMEPFDTGQVQEMLSYQGKSFDPQHQPFAHHVRRAATNLVVIELYDDREVLLPVHSTVCQFVFSSLAQDTLAILAGDADLIALKRPEWTLERTINEIGEMCVLVMKADVDKVMQRYWGDKHINLEATSQSLHPMAQSYFRNASKKQASPGTAPSTATVTILKSAMSNGHLTSSLFLIHAQSNWLQYTRGLPESSHMAHAFKELCLSDLRPSQFRPWAANMDTDDQIGAAFDWALCRGHRTLFNMALKEVESQSNLTRASITSRLIDGSPALHIACKRGDMLSVQRLVQFDHKSLHFYSPNGMAAIHVAAANDQVELVQYLLEQNESLVWANSRDGKLALHIAVQTSSSRCVKLLCRETSVRTASTVGEPWHLDKRNPISPAIRDELGRSPLFYAISESLLPMIEILASTESEDFLRIVRADNSGEDPVHHAVKKGHEHVLFFTVDLLLEGKLCRRQYKAFPSDVAMRSSLSQPVSEKLAVFILYHCFGPTEHDLKNIFWCLCMLPVGALSELLNIWIKLDQQKGERVRQTISAALTATWFNEEDLQTTVIGLAIRERRLDIVSMIVRLDPTSILRPVMYGLENKFNMTTPILRPLMTFKSSPGQWHTWTPLRVAALEGDNQMVEWLCKQPLAEELLGQSEPGLLAIHIAALVHHQLASRMRKIQDERQNLDIRIKDITLELWTDCAWLMLIFPSAADGSFRIWQEEDFGRSGFDWYWNDTFFHLRRLEHRGIGVELPEAGVRKLLIRTGAKMNMHIMHSDCNAAGTEGLAQLELGFSDLGWSAVRTYPTDVNSIRLEGGKAQISPFAGTSMPLNLQAWEFSFRQRSHELDRHSD